MVSYAGFSSPEFLQGKGGEMSDYCDHDKVYASYMLTSDPPLYPWICRKCGAEGTDRGQPHKDEYAELKRNFLEGK